MSQECLFLKIHISELRYREDSTLISSGLQSRVREPDSLDLMTEGQKRQNDPGVYVMKLILRPRYR